MNSIRALNVRTAIERNFRTHPSPGPDIRAASSGIAPIKPAGHVAPNKTAETLSPTAIKAL